MILIILIIGSNTNDRSMKHLRTHENLVLGRVGYKGDYGSQGARGRAF